MSVLENIFGPSKGEIWGQVANEIGGEIIDGGFWATNYLEFSHKNWTIILDNYSTSNGSHGGTTYTRMRAPFVNKDGLYFNIYEEGFFSQIGKLFGIEDLKVGDEYFDSRFVIKGNKQDKIQQLLNSDSLRELFSSIQRVNLKIKDKEFRLFRKSFPDGVDMLYFETVGVIKDTATLKNLFLLFSVVLERLVQIDSAYEDDPNIDLT